MSDFKKDVQDLVNLVHKRAMAGDIAELFDDEFYMLVNRFVEKWEPK